MAAESSVSEEEESVYIEKFKSLKELSQLQGKLHRLEAQLERWYVESENCRELVEGCGCELEKLAEEKQRLTERIETIDQDMKQMRELHQALQGDQRLKLEAVPVRQYESVLSLVNTCRSTLGLGSLQESQACKAAKERTGDGHRKKPARMKTPVVRESVVGGARKSGPSYKSCPNCFKQVSRNAVVCPHCMAGCRLAKKRRRISTRKVHSSKDTKPS